MSEFRDSMTATTLRAGTYLHGGGAGDAGLQLTLVDERTERAVCVRIPGPTAEEWLRGQLQRLRKARARAIDAPWGDDDG
jgi:hypothetical protein